jgi:hypothetical protein
MDLFMDTTTALENAVEVLLDANARYSRVVDRLDTLENLLVSVDASDDILIRLKELETSFQNSSLQLEDSDALLKLIQKAHEKINSLIDGTIPTELQYNTDVIFKGKGTSINKSSTGHIKINNDVVGYTPSQTFLWSIAGKAVVGNEITNTNLFDAGALGAGADFYAIWTRLQDYTNRLSLYETFLSDPNDDLYIYIDDSTTAWQVGHVFKIVFDTINIDGNSIIIKTGKTSGFTKTIATIEPDQLITAKPYIEITCLDPVNYKFEADILR